MTERRGSHTRIVEQRLLLSVPEAARTLHIGTTLAYELIGRGVLPHVRLGRALRIPRLALEAWIAANTRGAPTQWPDSADLRR